MLSQPCKNNEIIHFAATVAWISKLPVLSVINMDIVMSEQVNRVFILNLLDESQHTISDLALFQNGSVQVREESVKRPRSSGSTVIELSSGLQSKPDGENRPTLLPKWSEKVAYSVISHCNGSYSFHWRFICTRILMVGSGLCSPDNNNSFYALIAPSSEPEGDESAQVTWLSFLRSLQV